MWKQLRQIFTMNQTPILIGGCERTGTSLMTAILDAHPDIYCIPEETNIFLTRRDFKSDFWNHQIQRIRITRDLLKRDIPASSKRWCEKSPPNVRYLEQLFREFGRDLKVILMIRDGRDVITSMHPLREGYYIPIERWINDTRQTIRWKDHPQVLLVPYESLVSNFRPVIEQVLTFLEAAMSQEVLDYTNYSGVQQHDAFHGQHLRPLYTASQRKWELPEHRERIDLFLQNEEVQELMNSIVDIRQAFDLSLENVERA